jgi:hypothetical protein
MSGGEDELVGELGGQSGGAARSMRAGIVSIDRSLLNRYM